MIDILVAVWRGEGNGEGSLCSYVHLVVIFKPQRHKINFTYKFWTSLNCSVGFIEHLEFVTAGDYIGFKDQHNLQITTAHYSTTAHAEFSSFTV